jgi:hypothetical protein
VISVVETRIGKLTNTIVLTKLSIVKKDLYRLRSHNLNSKKLLISDEKKRVRFAD